MYLKKLQNLGTEGGFNKFSNTDINFFEARYEKSLTPYW